MRSSNSLLLSSLAISDGIVMVIYIIYDLGFRLVARLENCMTKEYAHLLLVCIVGQNLFHTFSTWIIVVLTAYRLLYIHAGPQARVVCAPLRVWLVIAMVALTSMVLAIPLVFAHEVTHYRKPNCEDLKLNEVDYVDSTVLQTILFYNSTLLVKAIPILLMWILSIILIKKIRETQTVRRRLLPLGTLQSSTTLSEPTTGCSVEDHRIQKLRWFFFKSCGRFDNCHQSTQPTKMLLAVALMYILTYLPQSVMLTLNRYMGRCFQVQVYERLGDVMDLMTLSNNGITFAIYCAMSTQFRHTFMALLASGRRMLSHV
ncbi:dro:myosuppressin receptor [Echinococcus multilocularis]|uniref:Dro:myosuppressin receptor n=1 Tax=Echinococcus multilocularis TaxID=6211 RepID=A0A068Y4H0_ECHMU|nr:dro:myosuppressin receptor [Echinococcus multilocularis]